VCREISLWKKADFHVQHDSPDHIIQHMDRQSVFAAEAARKH
jgi:hypothetical protein